MGKKIKEYIEHLTTECPKCEEQFVFVPLDSGYVVIDDVRYLVPQPVCDLLEMVSRERDELKERMKNERID